MAISSGSPPASDAGTSANDWQMPPLHEPPPQLWPQTPQLFASVVTVAGLQAGASPSLAPPSVGKLKPLKAVHAPSVATKPPRHESSASRGRRRSGGRIGISMVDATVRCRWPLRRRIRCRRRGGRRGARGRIGYGRRAHRAIDCSRRLWGVCSGCTGRGRRLEHPGAPIVFMASFDENGPRRRATREQARDQDQRCTAVTWDPYAAGTRRR